MRAEGIHTSLECPVQAKMFKVINFFYGLFVLGEFMKKTRLINFLLREILIYIKDVNDMIEYNSKQTLSFIRIE